MSDQDASPSALATQFPVHGLADLTRVVEEHAVRINDLLAAKASSVRPSGPPSAPVDLTDDEVLDLFTYHKPDSAQLADMEAVRSILIEAYKTVRDRCPAGAFRSVAFRHIIDARMAANAAISFKGKY